MDLISVGIGAIIGIVIAFLMVEIGMKKILPWAETSRLTSMWSLDEIKGNKPLLVVAEYIEYQLPKDSRVIVKQRTGTAMLRSTQTVVNPNVTGNFAVGEDRALIFSGHIKDGVFAIWTTNEKIISRLTSEFNRLWLEGK